MKPMAIKPKRQRWLKGALVVLTLLVVAAGIGGFWYRQQLEPVNPSDTARKRVVIKEGSSSSEVARQLETEGLIRNHFVFEVYTRIEGFNATLQAGVYSLSPSDSLPAIARHITGGKSDSITITFLPGATLAENRQQLLNAGFDATKVDAALKKSYDHPLFAAKPISADLEGYIFGETYEFRSDATVEEVLTKTFDHYYDVLVKNDLITKLAVQDLSLYEGITMASIVQREVSNPQDQTQVAQVFLKRLREGMVLGSDVTFIYAAKKLGVPPSVSLDSPYNTRRYAGLPPGPIASPGVGALSSVASPAATEYLYFVAGDDGKTYFSYTQAEHEAKVRQYCHKKCEL